MEQLSQQTLGPSTSCVSWAKKIELVREANFQQEKPEGEDHPFPSTLLRSLLSNPTQTGGPRTFFVESLLPFLLEMLSTALQYISQLQGSRG